LELKNQKVNRKDRIASTTISNRALSVAGYTIVPSPSPTQFEAEKTQQTIQIAGTAIQIAGYMQED
jgi:hypothetical protein